MDIKLAKSGGLLEVLEKVESCLIWTVSNDVLREL